MSDQKEKRELIPITGLVYSIRGHRVLLDQDLARLYGVETRVVNQQVKRNIGKFEDDFMFKLTEEEFRSVRDSHSKSQNVTSSWGGRRHPPYAFTRKGILMLANVLRSKTADDVSKLLVRTFDRIQIILQENKDLKKRIEKLEREAARDNRVIQSIYSLIDSP